MTFLHKSICYLIIGLSTLLLSADLPSPLIGKKAPDFTVAKLNGDSISLHDYKGKVVVVHLWSQTCPHCRFMNETLPDIVNPYKNANLAYIMISIDTDTSTLRKVIKEDALDFAIHTIDPFDGASKTMLAYQATGTPCINIVDERGILIAANITDVQLGKFLKKHFPKNK